MPPKELVDEIEKAYNEYKKEKEKEVDYLTFYCGFVACNRNRQQENNKLLDVINNQDVKIADLEKENAELKEQLEICETNADTYYDELTKLQEQLVKSTQIGLTCSNCKWSQYDEDEMCYCCSNKDKWELKLRR